VRILHLITTLDVGGAEMHLLAQVRGQAARGHAVTVLWLKGRGSLAADFRAAGAERVERAALPFGLLAAVRRADLVHSHLLKADMVAALGALLAGRAGRLVASKHNDERALLRAPVSLVHGVLGNVARRTIVLSEHVGRFVERYGRVSPSRIVRVYYGLDPEPFERAARAAREQPARRAALRAGLGLREEDVVLVCVARFAPQKAHDVLLRAFAIAAREEPRLALLLVGDDPFGDGRERAQALAAELALGARAVFAGIRRDVPELLAASDAFVMCSLWEGLGLVFLEAMAAGLPVLATRVSAVPEVVLDGRTGLLVPPSDDRALAAGMVALARDRGLRERLGEAGRERVAQAFGLERMVEETLAVYAQALGRAPAAAQGLPR
jgi:glycosyltransferase involved in cell wall biosynthesis